MKEEANLYSFILLLFAFLSFIFVFTYNLYQGNEIDFSLLRASLVAFFSFLPLKCFIYCVERARSKPPAKNINPEGENPEPRI